MKKLTAILTIATTASLLSAHAATIVDLSAGFPYNTSFSGMNGSGLGNGASDFDNDGTSDDSTRGYIYTTPTANNYGTTVGTTSIGYSLSGRSVTANLNSATVPNVASTSNGFTTGSIRMRPLDGTAALQTSDMGTTSWLAFEQSSWDNLDSGAAGFDATSSLSIGLSNVGTQNVRFLVLADGNYYLSNTTGTGTSLSVANAATETFYTYSNATGGRDILFDQGSESTVTGSTLSNITAVGFYLDKMNFDGSALATTDIDANVTAFTVTAIPEPSSIALIGLALGALALFRRRK